MRRLARYGGNLVERARDAMWGKMEVGRRAALLTMHMCFIYFITV